MPELDGDPVLAGSPKTWLIRLVRNLELPLNEPRPTAVTKAVDTLAASGGLEERGAVFTKSGVVDAILDLCGYRSEQRLVERRLLEPSFGDGDFLLLAVARLADSFWRTGRGEKEALDTLSDAIRGVELHRETFEKTSLRVVSVLKEAGFTDKTARGLVGRWLVNDDFLLADIDGTFDFVVGNPPYVRQERIPDALLRLYKRRYATLYDRADLYVLFYERGLDLLREGGALGFICANRWIKNKYGGPLREKTANGFRLKFFIDLERADAFHSEVIAYPAITVIERSQSGGTLVALGNRDSAAGLEALVAHLLAVGNGKAAPTDYDDVAAIKNVACRRDPWLLDAPRTLHIVRELEARLPTLEDAGAKVGIGVATGCDRVFLGRYDDLPVEEDRKLKMAMAADCADGLATWSGWGVVNPYTESGQLAPLEEFPRFAAYMEAHGEALKKRHTAQKQPSRWYKTIDRIYPELVHRPKLLIPDIKGEATVAYDGGVCYPHHNLYVITSEEWDLRALQAVLRSSVALMFVAAYCIRMSGGFLRFQAQYLRRIRCPRWADLDEASRIALVEVALSPDQEAIDTAVLPLFGLSDEEARLVSEFASEVRVLRKAS